MNVYFTADTHFGHRAMIENGWRPQYKTVAEMDSDMIERWNSVVSPEDAVWHLGDFGMGGMFQFLPHLRKLNGIKHLITGNHDRVWPANRDAHKYQRIWLEAGFDSIQAYSRRRINGQNVLLSHFPYEGDHVEVDRYQEYRLRDTGMWLLHGHVHDVWKVHGRQINVGVDVWDFAPVSLDQIIEVMQS